jgi:hypothetical protein
MFVPAKSSSLSTRLEFQGFPGTDDTGNARMRGVWVEVVIYYGQARGRFALIGIARALTAVQYPGLKQKLRGYIQKVA